MVFDMLTMIVLGCVLEALCVKFGSEVFNGVPTATFSLLITFLAVTRWNLWGLLVCPFLALATVYGGSLIQIREFQAAYTWEVGVSVFAGMLTFGINVFFFRKGRTKNVINSTWLLGLPLLNYLLFVFVQVYLYRLLTSGSIFQIGVEMYSYTYVTSENIEKLVEVNLCQLVDGSLIYNLFGLAVMYIGVYVLRSQGVLCNAVERLIDDRKNAELNRLDKKFTISEVDDDSVGENQSSNEE